MNAIKTYADAQSQGLLPETIRVLLVADKPLDVEAIQVLLRQCPGTEFTVASVGSTEACLAALKVDSIDLVLVDHNRAGVDAISFLKSFSHNGELPPVIVLTGRADERVAEEAMRSGALDCLPKDRMNSQALARSIHRALEKFWLNEQVDEVRQVIFALAAAVEAKDSATEGHLRRMAHYALQLGQALRLNQQQLVILNFGGILHDIGKIGVSEAILRKPGPLTEAEWEEMRQHPIIGERICAPLNFLREVRPMIRHHHERWDGNGYPDSLSGKEIPFLARAISVVDAFDAMTSDRPYREALPVDEAVRRLSDGAGSHWDPYITRVFLNLIRHEGTDLLQAATGCPPAERRTTRRKVAG